MQRLLYLFVGYVLAKLFGGRGARVLEGATITVGEMPAGARAAASMCEGRYDCFVGGSIFNIGDRTTIGFWSVSTCPATTTLGDGSSWRLIPGSCSC